jgi:hypothetical protein
MEKVMGWGGGGGKGISVRAKGMEEACRQKQVERVRNYQ